MFASINGKLIPKNEATIEIDNIHLIYGFGVYETLKLRNKKIYFIEDHIDRLFQSAKIITLEHTFTKSNIKKWITHIIEKNNTTSTNIKIILLGAKTPSEARLYIFFTSKKYVQSCFTWSFCA